MTSLGLSGPKRSGVNAAALNWPLVGAVALLSLLGVYNLHSAAAADAPALYIDQLMFLVGGGIIAALLLVPDYRVTEGLAYPIYAVLCVLLLAVVVHGLSAKGAQRWLVIGPMRFQPSEFAKLGTVMCLARYCSTRIQPDGYSLWSLLRPLNPSRPLAVGAGIALFWHKPWLVDLPGQLARTVRAKMGGLLLTPGDLLWFRVSLALGIVTLAALAVLIIVRIERSQALLNPWPPGRRARLIAATVLGCVVLGAWLAVSWDKPWLRDPLAASLNALCRRAAPGGVYQALSPGYGLRLTLVAVTSLYMLASLFAVRHASSAVDVLIAPIDLLAVPAALIAVQPDLDNAIILFLSGLSVIFVVGVRLRSIIVLAVLAAALAGGSWFGVLKDYQKRRILTFIDPEHDVQGAGWNAVQSMIAVGSGRWFGKGHMEGTQTQLSFLPEQHTDFAFSVWAEEQGFVGCVLLLGLYLAMLLLALGVAADAREPYGALLAAGIAAGLFWETVINIGMVIGLLPVVGMTLPFFSYGGSSLIAKLVAIGVLLNVHLRRRVS